MSDRSIYRPYWEEHLEFFFKIFRSLSSPEMKFLVGKHDFWSCETRGLDIPRKRNPTWNSSSIGRSSPQFFSNDGFLLEKLFRIFKIWEIRQNLTWNDSRDKFYREGHLKFFSKFFSIPFSRSDFFFSEKTWFFTISKLWNTWYRQT